MNQPKPVVISSLAVRFYSAHGWTRELLEQYVVRGRLEEKHFNFGKDDPYWIPDVGCDMDVRRLMNDGHVGEVQGKEDWGETRGMSDYEVLKLRMW